MEVQYLITVGKVPTMTNNEGSISPSHSLPNFLMLDAVEEDFTNLPLDSLLLHKNWKGRKAGFEQVRDQPKELRIHLLNKPKKIYAEQNIAAQEALFEALAALVPFCDNDELDVLAGEPLRVVVEKGLTGRSKAAQASFAFALDLVGAGKQTHVFNVLLPAVAHKTPKNRIAATQLCGHIVDLFGVHGLPAKALLKAMQPLFNDPNPQVRKEAANLCCHCYSYIGAGVKSCLTDLREVQLQELEKQFENIVLGRVPRRNIKGIETSTPIKSVAPIVGIASRTDRSNNLDDDAYAACSEEPVVSKIPRTFYLTALDRSARWQDRVAAVQETVLPLISVPKIRQKDDYHELCTMIREYLVDPQAPLMLVGFKCIQEMARSLRNAFAPYARTYLNPLFEKMKDKKTSVVEHVTTTLESLIRYHCITLDQCHDEIDVTLQSRVPNQRLALIQWLSRLTDKLEPTCFNRICRAQPMLSRVLNDEKIENREAAYIFVAKLMALNGEEHFQALLVSLDEKQRAKLVAIINSAANMQCTPSSSPARKAPRLEQRCESIGQRPQSSSVASSCSRSSVCGARGGRLGRALSHNKSLPEQPRVSGMEDAVTLESMLPSKDEAFNLILGLLGGDMTVSVLLTAKEWSSRHCGVLKVKNMVVGWSEKESTDYLDHVVVYLRVDPGWRESIFQVFNAMASVLQEVVNKASKVSPGAGHAIISGCLGRLTDQKSKSVVCDLITSLTKSLGAAFVLRHVVGTLVQIKTPKLLHESNVFMTQLLRSTTVSPSDAKCVVDYVNNHCAEHLFPTVRTTGATLLAIITAGSVASNEDTLEQSANTLGQSENTSLNGTVANASRTGPRREASQASTVTSYQPVRERDENERLRTNSVTTNATEVKPTSHPRHAHVEASRLNSWDKHKKMSATVDDEENHEAVDIGPQLTLLAKQITGAPDWRTRLEGVKKVEELVFASNKRICPNGVTEIIGALRSRFDETNKNIVVDALRIISLVVEAAGFSASRTGVKGLVQRLLGMLGDQKVNLREEAARLAGIALDCLGLEPILQHIQKPLMAESHTSNLVALGLIEKGLEQNTEGNVSRRAVNSLVPTIVRLCMSRILEVRSAAERVIGHVLPFVGEETVLRSVKNLRPAEQQSVMALLGRQLQHALRNGNDEGTRAPSVCLNNSTSPRCSNSSPRSQCSSRAGARESCANLRSLEVSGVVPPGKIPHMNLPIIQAQSASEASLTSVTAASARNAQGFSRNEELLSIQEMMVGLRSASATAAMAACSEFLQRLPNGEDCGTPEMIHVMVERLHDNIKQLNVELALDIIRCLKATFETERCAQRCHTSLLFRMLGMIFECLLSESFSLHSNVIKALNNTTLTLLERCPPNDVFSALMSRMTMYSSTYIENGTKPSLKYVQVTVKCLMRLGFTSISPENVIVCCHEYLLQHPPTAFRNLDDISIRTVKTILQDFCRRYGLSLLEMTNKLVGSQNLVSHFIRSCLDVEEQIAQRDNVKDPNRKVEYLQQSRKVTEKGAAATQNEQVNNQKKGAQHVDPQTYCTSRGSLSESAAPDDASVVGIFSRIRNHETTNSGIEELYQFIKCHPRNPTFEKQFRRCSEAFRSYIKRKMESQMMKDDDKPPGFALPEILRLTA